MNKEKIFEKEINYISDSGLREDAKYIINSLPDYFFKIPASSTGKYHPEFAASEAGLVKHTKVAVRIAYELLYQNMTTGHYFSDREKDLIILSILIHDGIKKGDAEETYTKHDHPILIAKHLYQIKSNLKMTDEDFKFIIGCVETHMGQWNESRGIILSLPQTKAQEFVHICDYLSSKKFINVEFDQNNDLKY